MFILPAVATSQAMLRVWSAPHTQQTPVTGSPRAPKGTLGLSVGNRDSLLTSLARFAAQNGGGVSILSQFSFICEETSAKLPTKDVQGSLKGKCPW